MAFCLLTHKKSCYINVEAAKYLFGLSDVEECAFEYLIGGVMEVKFKENEHKLSH